MGTLILQASPAKRVKAFLEAYLAADNDADLDVRIGHIDDGQPAVILSICGTHHGFTSDEARRLAIIVEEGMHACPNDPETAGLPNLILALRIGADRADERAAPPSGAEG